MRAVVYRTVRGRPEVLDVAEPAAPSDGVVVRVLATGMCRSDWHAWAGHEEVALPHVPGHELAGVVVEVGPAVAHWHVGDRVTVPFVCGCGRCEFCRSGNAQVCPDQEQPGFTHWGSFAEYVALHHADANLVGVPEGVELAAAASLGCRFATAYRALVHRARIEAGEWVTVVGAGGVGLSAVMIARAFGGRVIAIDRSPDALDRALQFGAEHVLLATGADLPLAVGDLTGGGSQVAIDAVGSEQTCAAALLSLRRHGRHVQVGLMSGRPRLPMDRVIGFELQILGSHGMAAVDYPQMIDLIDSGRLEPQRLIERTVGLADAARSLPGLDRPTVAGITVIDPRL